MRRMSVMLGKRMRTTIAFLILWGVTSTQAGFVTYSDSTAWSSAVSNATTVSIPDQGDFAFIGQGSASVTYDGVEFSTIAAVGDGLFFNIGPGFSGAPPVLSSQQITTGLANILITFPFSVYACSLNFGTFDGSDVTLQFSNRRSVTVGSIGSGYDAPSFVGVTDTTSFSAVLLTSPDAAINLNNVSYANLRSVPEPASLWLLIFGAVASLGLVRRAREQTAIPAGG